MSVDLRLLEGSEEGIAEVTGGAKSIKSMDAVMDLIGKVAFEHRLQKILLKREQIDESFFDLKSGFAGELAQKLSNYQLKMAVVGDFNFIESLALKAYIHESNLGRTAYFTKSRAAAVAWLQKA